MSILTSLIGASLVASATGSATEISTNKIIKNNLNEIGFTDHKFESKIWMPGLGSYYSVSDLKDIFNNSSLNKFALNYINTKLGSSIESIKVNGIYNTKNINGIFNKSSEITPDDSLVGRKYFYVEFYSNNPIGKFDVLVKNNK